MIDAQRVKEAMERRRFSQAALARSAGISPAAVQQILNGSTKKSRSLVSIAKALNVRPEWLEGEDAPAEISLPAGMDRVDADLVAIQRLYWDDSWSELQAKKRRMRVIVSRSWLLEMTGFDDEQRLVFLKVGDNSMSPTIQSGDEIGMFVVSDYDNSSGSVWIIRLEGHSLFRRLRPIGDDEIEVSADNPAVPSFNIPRSMLHCSGRLVWHCRAYPIKKPMDNPELTA